jgi:hypothetical protein
MPQTGEPYLSLVVAARNDDHGGNLLGRMQAFVSGWIAQANRHRIPSELIVVEWNPPEGRPRLHEVLRWPANTGFCQVRFIEVPSELHDRFTHAKALPLYQMIGKNVGIRRARGQFILATNIDILFSDELAAWLAERKIELGRMYRIDRHDVMSEVPVEAPVEEQLAYCASHLIRINAREGTFPVTPDGRRALAREDLARVGEGILFGRGWYAVEKYGRQEPFRWAGPCAEVVLEEMPGQCAVLRMDLEPGPGTGGVPLQLEVADEVGRVLAEVQVGWRSRLQLPLASPAPRRLLFHSKNGGLATSTDPRIMNFRVFQVNCEKGRKMTSVEVRPIGMLARLRILLGMLDHAVERLATGGDRVALTVPVSSRMRLLFHRYLRIRRTEAVATVAPALPAIPPPLFLHTNACGDFTLMAWEHWFDLRAYAELDLFSMNLDSLFCAAAHHGGAAETILSEPMRIYHIEHGAGSGWTPEGQARLFERLAASGIPYLESDEVLRWAAQMKWLNSPLIFNHENWGMADFVLKETVIHGPEQ